MSRFQISEEEYDKIKIAEEKTSDKRLLFTHLKKSKRKSKKKPTAWRIK